MIVASGVESGRHVFGLVPIDEKQAPEHDTLGIECGIGSQLGTDVTGGGRGVRQLQLLTEGGVQYPPPPLRSNVGGPFSSMLSRRHRSREQRKGMKDLLDRFIELQQIQQYDVSCQEDSGQNPSSADTTITKRRENARFWLRKRF